MSFKKIIWNVKSFSIVCMLSLSMSAFTITADTEESFFERFIRWIKETFFSEIIIDDDISESDLTSEDDDIIEDAALNVREKYRGLNAKIGEDPPISLVKLELDQLGFSLRKLLAEQKNLGKITGKIYLNYLDLYELYRECLKKAPRKPFVDHQLFEYQGKVSEVIKEQLDCVKELK